ncbi:MAG: LytTR family DNA-binding domain-containing protein [Lachnospiraceae bacterium]
MKIQIDVDPAYDDIHIKIECGKLTPEIDRMISLIRMLDMQIPAKKNGETYLIDVAKLLYVEAVERTTFLYTEDNVYESDLKLYELEQQLTERGFLRISKQTLVHLKKIKSLKADLNRKIRVTLCNGEQIMVSRMYADEFRKRIGIK